MESDWLSANRAGTQLPAHLAAAIVVACEFTYEEALCEIAKLKSLSTEESKPWTSPSAKIRTIEEARDFLRQSNPYPSRLRIGRPHIYWLLRLNDSRWFSKWLAKNYPNSVKQPAVPSIKADRATICNGDAPKRIKAEARARASARDFEWMAAYTYKKNIGDSSSNDGLIENLSKHKAEHFVLPGRPVKWTWLVAVSRVKISESVLRYKLAKSNAIGGLVPESAEEYLERLFRWGVAECQRRGEVLNFKNLRTVAQFSWDQVRAANLLFKELCQAEGKTGADRAH